MLKDKSEYIICDDRDERPLSREELEDMRRLENDIDIQNKIKEFREQMKQTLK